MAKKYMGVVTLESFMEIVKEELAKKLEQADISNYLNTGDIITNLEDYVATEEGDRQIIAASVVQELKEYITTNITNINSSIEEITGGGEGGAVMSSSVIDSWDDYDAEATQVVAATLVKVLKDQLDSLQTSHDTLATQVSNLQSDFDDLDVQGEITKAINDLKGESGGLVGLDENGMISSDYLPSYVDDVIEGYMVDGVFYEPNEAGDGASSTEITGEKGKIYVDLTTDLCYRWSGSVYVEVSSNDMVEITADEVEDIWNEVLASIS